jgi:hypothetical protein
MTDDPELQLTARRARQKRTLLALATSLIAAGRVVLFVLKRMPLPLRIMVGLGDLFAGCVMLVLVRQKLRDP